MEACSHLGYTKMAITSQPLCRSTWCLVLGWGFRLRLVFYYMALNTRTAVARNPCVSWAFLYSRSGCRVPLLWFCCSGGEWWWADPTEVPPWLLHRNPRAVRRFRRHHHVLFLDRRNSQNTHLHDNTYLTARHYAACHWSCYPQSQPGQEYCSLYVLSTIFLSIHFLL